MLRRAGGVVGPFVLAATLVIAALLGRDFRAPTSLDVPTDEPRHEWLMHRLHRDPRFLLRIAATADVNNPRLDEKDNELYVIGPKPLLVYAEWGVFEVLSRCLPDRTDYLRTHCLMLLDAVFVCWQAMLLARLVTIDPSGRVGLRRRLLVTAFFLTLVPVFASVLWMRTYNAMFGFLLLLTEVVLMRASASDVDAVRGSRRRDRYLALAGAVSFSTVAVASAAPLLILGNVGALAVRSLVDRSGWRRLARSLGAFLAGGAAVLVAFELAYRLNDRSFFVLFFRHYAENVHANQLRVPFPHHPFVPWTYHLIVAPSIVVAFTATVLGAWRLRHEARVIAAAAACVLWLFAFELLRVVPLGRVTYGWTMLVVVLVAALASVRWTGRRAEWSIAGLMLLNILALSGIWVGPAVATRYVRFEGDQSLLEELNAWYR